MRRITRSHIIVVALAALALLLIALFWSWPVV